MGASNNTAANEHSDKQFNAAEKAMPVYYTIEPLNQEDLLIAHFSWQTILNNLSPQFLKLKVTANLQYSSCIVYFHDTFFNRFVEIYPPSKSLFKGGIKSKGKFLTNLISLSMKECSTVERNDLMAKFSEMYSELNFKAPECKSLFYIFSIFHSLQFFIILIIIIFFLKYMIRRWINRASFILVVRNMFRT
jgi:hypothetical protein